MKSRSLLVFVGMLVLSGTLCGYAAWPTGLTELDDAAIKDFGAQACWGVCEDEDCGNFSEPCSNGQMKVGQSGTTVWYCDYESVEGNGCDLAVMIHCYTKYFSCTEPNCGGVCSSDRTSAPANCTSMN